MKMLGLDPVQILSTAKKEAPTIGALAVSNPLGSGEADARTRTGDPFITSEVLYQLSYVGLV